MSLLRSFVPEQYRISVKARVSLRFQMVSYFAFIADDDVSGLAESFNHVQGIGFGYFMSEVRNQKTDERFFGPRARGRRFAKMFQHPSFPFAQDGRRRFGLRLKLRFAGSGGCGCDPGVANKWEGLEATVPPGGNMSAPEVFD